MACTHTFSELEQVWHMNQVENGRGPQFSLAGEKLWNTPMAEAQ
jgi:hypothetical protein